MNPVAMVSVIAASMVVVELSFVMNFASEQHQNVHNFKIDEILEMPNNFLHQAQTLCALCTYVIRHFLVRVLNFVKRLTTITRVAIDSTMGVFLM